ncbi:MAG: hypothetical protein Q7R96_03545 [Nanoarchaeota archaeon]|nr:hypothetical protein [Nanoarchaeota archaeon]
MQKRFISILLGLIFIAACTGLGGGQQAGNDKGFAGGNQALALAFIEGEPPAKVLDNNQESFPLTLLLSNQGEYTIPKGKILASLSGISREAFGLNSLTVKSTFDLEKRSKTRDQVNTGGQEELSFGDAKYKPNLPADFGLTLRADICYDYQNEAVTAVCLKKEVLNRATINDNCALDTQNGKIENSGGPLQISNFHQRPTGTNKIRISFDVANKGVGAAYPPGTFTAVCGGGDEKALDSVEVSISSTGNKYKISCSKFNSGDKGTIRLVNGIKTVTCEIDTNTLQEAAFTDFFIIKTRYQYRDGITYPITIENSDF